MAFDPVVAPVPTSVKRLELRLISEMVWDEGSQQHVEQKSGQFRFVVVDQLGRKTDVKKGDLLPHVQGNQVLHDGLIGLLDWARTEAEATIP